MTNARIERPQKLEADNLEETLLERLRREDRIVLIVDRGLIRTAKVLSFFLALFTALGILLFNFDVWKARNEVEDATGKVASFADQASKNADKAKEKSTEAEQLVDKLRGDYNKLQEQINDNQRRANEIERKVSDIITGLGTNVANSFGIMLEENAANKSKGDARIFYEDVRDLSRKQSLPSLEVFMVRRLAALEWSDGNPDKAREYFSEAGNLAEQGGDFATQGQVLLELGALEMSLSRREDREESFEAAIYDFQEALRIFGKIGKTQDEARALVQLGEAYRARREYDVALSFYKQAIERYSIDQTRRELAGVLDTLAKVYAEMNDNGNAIEQYAKEVGILISIADFQRVSYAYRELALIHASEDRRTAVKYYCLYDEYSAKAVQDTVMPGVLFRRQMHKRGWDEEYTEACQIGPSLKEK
jgi:tetratricopeptide (TPR) repeat protein